MNFFEKIVYGLDAQMIKPQMYGWFHLLFMGIMIATTVLLCIFCKNCSKKAVKWLVFSAWLVMLIFEIFKQLVFSFNYDPSTGTVVWDYQWYAFPYQLCSTPLYALPFVAFCKDGKFRDSMIAFVSTLAFFGGLVTMIYPATVFTGSIVVNLQTMIHHGLQVALGIFLLVHERRKLNFKYFLRGVAVFAVALGIAMAANFIMRAITTETFNMFYISPYYSCELPLLDMIQANTHYVVFLLVYIVGFFGAAIAMYYIQYGFIKLGMRPKKARKIN